MTLYTHIKCSEPGGIGMSHVAKTNQNGLTRVQFRRRKKLFWDNRIHQKQNVPAAATGILPTGSFHHILWGAAGNSFFSCSLLVICCQWGCMRLKLYCGVRLINILY